MSLIRTWRDRGYGSIYGTDTIQSWCAKFIEGCDPSGPVRVLDVGCGNGRDLLAIRDDAGAQRRTQLYGIECTEELARQARARGVTTFALDLECQRLPFDDGFFDIVIANQVLEHLKNWIWAFNEQIRVTRRGGIIIIGVPNLAAIHNRVLVLLGRQPSCIKADGPHVRGFTHHELARLADSAEGIEILRTSGTLMYGVPPVVGRALGRSLPSLSATVLFAFRKSSNDASVLSLLTDAAKYETNYFTGTT